MMVRDAAYDYFRVADIFRIQRVSFNGSQVMMWDEVKKKSPGDFRKEDEVVN